MDKLMAILKECCPMVNFQTETQLWRNKVIDSMDMVNIIAALEKNYDISIEFDMIVPENFDSIEKISQLVKKLQKVG